MNRLDEAIAQAQERSIMWEPERASRVLSSTLARKKVRAVRERVAQRALVAASVSALLAVVLLRVGSAGPAYGGDSNLESASQAGAPQAFASEPAAHRPLDDGGYGRD